MFVRIAYRIVQWALARKSLTLTQRNLFTGLILDNLQALPLASIITTDGGNSILINGEPLDFEKSKMLREAAKAALSNKALQLMEQEVLVIAIQRGLHKATTPEELYFYRAAIWYGKMLFEHLGMLVNGAKELSL